MWVTTGAGKLVNLDQVQTVSGKRDGNVVAAFPDGSREETLIAATKAKPEEYINQIAAALASGAAHVDLRRV